MPGNKHFIHMWQDLEQVQVHFRKKEKNCLSTESIASFPWNEILKCSRNHKPALLSPALSNTGWSWLKHSGWKIHFKAKADPIFSAVNAASLLWHRDLVFLPMTISYLLFLTLPRYVTTTRGHGGMCVLDPCEDIAIPSSHSNVQRYHFFCTKTCTQPYTHILHMTAQCNVLVSMWPRKIKHDSLWNATGTKGWFTAFTQISVLQRATDLPIPLRPRLAEMWFYWGSWQSHPAGEPANAMSDMWRCVVCVVWRNCSFDAAPC